MELSPRQIKTNTQAEIRLRTQSIKELERRLASNDFYNGYECRERAKNTITELAQSIINLKNSLNGAQS